MTVYENLAFGLKLRKFSKEEIDKRVKEAADILGIGDYLNRKPKALSGGQRQRVAVGRAIVRKPAVFLFDEPLSNLDAKMRVQMRAEINKLHTRLGTTMIYVTHDQIEAMTMGDRICVMKDGVIQQIDTPLNIYDKPANTFVAGFIGTPPMNIFKGTLASEDGKLVFKAGPISIALPADWNNSIESYVGKEILFGIRPEDIGSERATNDANAPKITAKVEVREPMGAEIYLHLDTGVDAACIARVEPHLDAKVGETITLKLAIAAAHVFDPATTNRIV
jgi:multiple sugar transport system ATP-binding protein